MGKFRSTSYTDTEYYKGKHRFEHWYRDNTVYFITSKVRKVYPAFSTTAAHQIFWDRFTHWSQKDGFDPWVITLMNNHYHSVGYFAVGAHLGRFIQHLHGSVAKLVNDTLDARIVPFWRGPGNKDYYDGCLRTEEQLRRAYLYTRSQAVKARVVSDWRDYPNTRVQVSLDDALARARELNVYLEKIPYKRYENRSR